ncbi:MAG: hypothetical protein JSS27_03065 [Planctomycetes bacterium]|nr:hypothetical protein [Planctomycetota bacterium]
MSLAAYLCLSILPWGAVDTVVVCPAEYRQALEPWLVYRRSQGHEPVVVDRAETAELARRNIARAVGPVRPRFVVLMGDADSPRSIQARRPDSVPTFYVDSEVVHRFGPENQLAADGRYGDFDDDGLPDAAVGRLPIRSPEQLRSLVERTIRYERSTDHGPWRRQLNVVAGAGGFGPVADAAIETVAKTILTQNVPAAYATTLTYANWRSPFFPGAETFRTTTMRRLGEGCLFWVYVGHAQPQQLDYVVLNERGYPILDATDAAALPARRATIALLLACYTGAFDDLEPSLAEALVNSPSGPVAALAGSRVTMPYAMCILATELLSEHCQQRHATLGELVLAAKQNLAATDRDSAQRRMFDAVARLCNPASGDLAAERRDHIQQFNLLGDPLLRLRPAEAAVVHAPAETTPGAMIEITGHSPLPAGVAHVELVVRRDRLTFVAPTRAGANPAPTAEREFATTYERANDPRLVAVQVPVRDGRFAAALRVPEGASGACHVRVFIEAATGHALGSSDLEIASRP